VGTRWARVRPSADPPAYAECRDHSATQAVRVSSGSSREGEMRSYAQHRIQGDLRAGIEQMVNRGVDLRAVAVKRFPRPVHTMSYLVVAVGKASPGHTDSQVGVFSQKSPDAQLAVDKRRGHRQPQRQVRLQKPRHVAVIKRICQSARALQARYSDLNSSRSNGSTCARPARRPAGCRHTPSAENGTNSRHIQPARSNSLGAYFPGIASPPPVQVEQAIVIVSINSSFATMSPTLFPPLPVRPGTT